MPGIFELFYPILFLEKNFFDCLMKRYLGTLIDIFLFLGFIILAASNSLSESEISIFHDHRSSFPTMIITDSTLRGWTGRRWDYYRYTDYYVYLKNVTATVQSFGHGCYNVKLHIIYDAKGNSTYSDNFKSVAYDRSAEVWISGPRGYISVYNMHDLDTISAHDIDTFLRFYCEYEIQQKLDRVFENKINSNLGGDAVIKDTHKYLRPTYFVPEPIAGRPNLIVSLPSKNISWSDSSIHVGISLLVYNATFYGNVTSSNNFQGRIYAKFNATAKLINGYHHGYRYKYVHYHDQELIYDVYNAASFNNYYNYSLVTYDIIQRDLLFSYYIDYAKPTILSAIRKHSGSTTTTVQIQNSSLALRENDKPSRHHDSLRPSHNYDYLSLVTLALRSVFSLTINNRGSGHFDDL